MKERDFNLLIVQAVKRDADFLIRRHRNLRIIEWNRGFSRAPLQVEKWDAPMDKLNSFYGVISAVNWFGLHSQPLFKRAAIRCFEENKVFEGSGNFPNLSQIYKEIDHAAKQLRLDGYEHKNARDHLKFVLQSFIETGEILDCKRGITIEDLISKEDIILNVMDEDSDSVVGTVITDIFRDLQRYYEKNPVYSPRLRTLIVIDECRRLMPSGNPKDQFVHNPHAKMESFVTSRRSCGIGVIAITQEPQSAPQWLTDNSAFVLAFPIGGKARDHLQQLLNLTERESAYFDELPSRGTAIFRDRRFNRRYLIDVPGDFEVEPITQEQTAELMAPFIQQLHARLDSEQVRANSVDLNHIEKMAGAQRIGIQILKILKDDQFMHHTQLHKLLRNEQGLSRGDIDLALDWLQKQQLILPKKCLASKSRAAIYYALTERSQDALAMPESQRIAVSRYKHYLYSLRVQSFLTSQGYAAILEYSEGDSKVTIRTKSGDELKILKRIDVVAIRNGEKTGYEITLSFSNLLSNLYKCLELFKINQVYIVCERKKPDLEKARQIVEQNVPKNLYKKIGYLSMSHFL